MNRILNLKLALCCCLAIAGFSTARAQVSGLSYNLQPTVDYNWFDNNSGVNDGVMYGGRVGFGFGESVELRGLYMRSLSSETDFEDFDYDDEAAVTFMGRDLDITRYGGEVKLNLSRGKLLPYLTLGAGIQELKVDTDTDKDLESENIYAAAGLGVTVSIFDRFTLNIEGRNVSYSQNAIRNLVPADELEDLNLDSGVFGDDRLYNWSVGAGLQFHLGGRKPGTFSELDQAYANAFKGGFEGASLLVEPTLTKINWDDGMPYVDTYMGGVSAGVDFGPLVGARLFYYRAMENEEVNFDFDDLSMYGADFRFRFNSVSSGVSPFLTIGGGYIDVEDDYRNRQETIGAPSQGFATGGGGLSLNISPYFRITGTYRALLTSASDIEDIDNTDQIRTSNQWSAGVNLAFGKPAERPDAMFTSTANDRLEAQRRESQMKMQSALAEQARKNKRDTKQLKEDYEARIEDLKEDLKQAQNDGDERAIKRLENQIDDAEDVVAELESRDGQYDITIDKAMRDSMDLRVVNANSGSRYNYSSSPSSYNNNQRSSNNGGINMSAAELENLIEEIFEGINDGLQSPMMMPPPMDGRNMNYDYDSSNSDNNSSQQSSNGNLESRVNDLEKDVSDLRSTVSKLADMQRETREEAQDDRKDILDEIREMRDDMSKKSDKNKREQRKDEKKDN